MQLPIRLAKDSSRPETTARALQKIPRLDLPVRQKQNTSTTSSPHKDSGTGPMSMRLLCKEEFDQLRISDEAIEALDSCDAGDHLMIEQLWENWKKRKDDDGSNGK